MGATSRTEVEVLLKMRQEGAQALDLFSGGLNKTGKAGTAAARGLDDVQQGARGVSVRAIAAGAAVGVLAERLAMSLLGGLRSSISEANKLDAAFNGLEAVAKGFGVNMEAAKAQVLDFAKNGLVTTQEAATALKNLLSVGYGLDESMQILKAHADAAAFNRQGMLGFGESIVRVTDGLKFNNSTLTDSTGLGKNLSAVMKDAGLSQDAFGNAVNDASARQAYLHETLKASQVFHGNAEKYARSDAGAQAAFGAAASQASAAVGKELNPRISELLGHLKPLLGFVKNNAGAVASLGIAVAGVVGPIVGYMGAVKGAQLALSALAKVSEVTVANLGALGTVGAVAGAIFAGWNIGRAIAQVFDLDQKIGSLTAKILGWNDAAQTSGAKQDTINAAMANYARLTGHARDATFTYTEAIEYQNGVFALRAAATDKSIDAQMRALEAERALGKITDEQYVRRLSQLEIEKRVQEIQGNRKALADQLAGAEAKVRDEIKSSGLSIGELTKAMGANKDTFAQWAQAHGLSEQTLAFLEDQLTKTKEAQKKSTEEAEKAIQVAQQQRNALEQLGIVTAQSVNKQLAELATLQARATAEGVPLERVVAALYPQFEELYKQALRSGIGIDAVRVAMEKARGILQKGIESMIALEQKIPEVDVSTLVTQFGTQLDPALEGVALQTELVNQTFDRFGLTAPDALRRTAEQSIFFYNQLVELARQGKATPEQVAAAFNKMQADVRAASGKVPSYWEKEVAPAITRTIEQLRTAISGSFAQMLLGAKGFGEGFTDIWKSIKASVLNVFNQIADAFIQGVLKKILGALSGSSGGITGGFGGFLNSILGGGKGAGGIPGLGSIPGLGTGAASAVLPGTALGPELGAGAAAGGGALLSGILGGFGAGAAGLGLGMFGKKLFGGAGGKAGAFGGASGFASGALIGSIVPGIGTLVGGAIGGLTGLFSGLFGKKKEGQKVNDLRDQFLGQFGAGGWGEGGAIDTLGMELTSRVGGNEANALLGKLFDAKKVKDFETAVAAVVEALQKEKLATEETNKASEEKQKQIDANTTKLKEQIGVIDQELQSLQESIAHEAPEEVMGVLEAQARARIQALEEEKKALNAQLHDAVNEQAGDTERALEESSDRLRQWAESGIVGPIRDAMDRIRRDAGDLRGDLENELGGPIHVSIVYDDPGAPTHGDGTTSENTVHAASGIFADRPTLTLFGEGGKAEVGGSKDFFRDVFRSIGIGPGTAAAAQGAGAGETYNLTFNVTTLNADGLRSAVEREIAPMFVDALRANRRQLRTDLRAVLGVTQ